MQTLATKNSVMSFLIVVKAVMLKTFTRALDKVITYIALLNNENCDSNVA